MAERNADGSWSAWDASHTIDVHILTISGKGDDTTIDAATMLGRDPEVRGAGWVGFVAEHIEPDDHVAAHRFEIAAAADNTLASCWVAYRDPAERSWGEKVLDGLAFSVPEPKKRRFGRR